MPGTDRTAPVVDTQVDTLALRLPPGFEKRAARIGRLTAQAMLSTPLPDRGYVARLSPPAVTVTMHWSDARIAAALAAAIRRELSGGEG